MASSTEAEQPSHDREGDAPRSDASENQRASMAEEARLARAIPGRTGWAKLIAVALILVGAVDAASTEIAMATGRVVEINPVIRTLQDAIGGWWIAAKMGAHLLLACAVLWYPNRPTLVAMAVVMLLTAAVAANNLLIYRNILASA